MKLTLLPLTITATILAAGSSFAAETFSVNGNMALNTNNAFGKIDGYPRMSIYSRSNSDPDQLFDRIAGNRGGILLRHKSTGLCLNVYRPQSGKEVNTYPCNPNDVDQNWSLPSLGNGQYLIKRADSNWCVDSPTRNSNGRVHVVGCDMKNVNQRWSSSTGSQISSQPLPENKANTPFLPFDRSVSLQVTTGYSGHTGTWATLNKYAIDFGAAGKNVSARATRTGVVTYAGGRNGGFGNVVEIRYNDGKYGNYQHLDKVYVAKGDTVAGGQALGTIGSTGDSTGQHLHYMEANSSFGTSVPLPQFSDAANVNFYNSGFSVTSQNPDNRR